MRKVLPLFVLILILSLPSLATTYYIATAGNDSWDGTEPAYVSGTTGPWATFTHANGQVSAGDTIEVRGGTYVEEFTLTADGESESRITYTNYDDEEVIIDGEYNIPDFHTHPLVSITGDYTTISNFTITRSSGCMCFLSGNYDYAVNIIGDGSYETGIEIAGDYCQLDGCVVTDNGNHYGQDGQSTWGAAIGCQGGHAEIKNCIAYDNRGEGINCHLGASDTLVEDCISYDNTAYGLYISGVTTGTFRRNIIYHSEETTNSLGIVIGAWGVGQPSNLDIYNNFVLACGNNLSTTTELTTLNNVNIVYNTFVNSTRTDSGYNMGIYFRDNINTYTNSTFKNNIVVEEDSGRYPIRVESSHSGFTFSYNCYNKTWSGSFPYSNAQGTGDVVDDPDLAKTGPTTPGGLTGQYFQILTSSPAKDSATNLGITTDYFLTARPQGSGYDMGGHEFIGTAPPSYLADFAHRKKITISNTNVDAELANFPVHVSIVNDADFDNCQADGDDIIFTDSEGTELYFELNSATLSVGSGTEADFYVLVPIVDADAPTEIYCYYENPGASKSAYSDPTKVFDTTNNWVAVWHLEESGSGYLDATGNDNDSVAQVAPTRVTGKVGYGQEFSNAEYIEIADSASLDIGTADFSFSCWVQKTGDGVDYVFAHRNDASGAGLALNFAYGVDPDRLVCTIEDADNVGVSCSISPSDIAYNTWYHLAFTCDRDNTDGFVAYKNGTSRGDVDPTPAQLSLASSRPAYIGKGPYDTTYYLTGILDEIRISNVVRPAAWAKFECLNMDDGHAAGNEITWGAEEDDPPEIEIQYVGVTISDGGTHAYGEVEINSITGHQFTVWNLGEADLTLSGSPIITIAGDNADQFSVIQQPTSPVTGSSYTLFAIGFAPTSIGAKTAAISIANSDADENPYDITLTGTAIYIPKVIIISQLSMGRLTW